MGLSFRVWVVFHGGVRQDPSLYTKFWLGARLQGPRIEPGCVPRALGILAAGPWEGSLVCPRLCPGGFVQLPPDVRLP